MTDPVNDKLFEDLQNSCNNQCTPLSEDAKLKIWVQGNAKEFEFCALSEKVHCTHCLRNSAVVWRVNPRAQAKSVHETWPALTNHFVVPSCFLFHVLDVPLSALYRKAVESAKGRLSSFRYLTRIRLCSWAGHGVNERASRPK